MPLQFNEPKAVLKPFKAKIVVATVILIIACIVAFTIKDAFFVRDMAVAGGFSIALSALNVLIIGKIWLSSCALDASGDTESAARKMVVRIMACSIAKLFMLMIGLTILVVVFKLQAIPVLIGVSANFVAIFALPFFSHASVPADISVSQQNRDA